MEDPDFIRFSSYWDDILTTGVLPLGMSIFFNLRIYFKVIMFHEILYEFNSKKNLFYNLVIGLVEKNFLKFQIRRSSQMKCDRFVGAQSSESNTNKNLKATLSDSMLLRSQNNGMSLNSSNQVDGTELKELPKSLFNSRRDVVIRISSEINTAPSDSKKKGTKNITIMKLEPNLEVKGNISSKMNTEPIRPFGVSENDLSNDFATDKDDECLEINKQQTQMSRKCPKVMHEKA